MLSIKASKSSLLAGKKVTVCVSGSVAVVRVPELVRELIRHGAEVRIVASDAALELVGEALLEWASGNEVVTSLTGKIEHVELGAYADLVLVCPATANTISKIAMGIDDTPVTSTVTCAIGADKKVIIVPAMHESMYRHPIVMDNLARLDAIRVKVVRPRLAEGKAKLADNDEITEIVIGELAEKDLEGRRIVIAAGPTYEAIDMVRGITNRSSGRMGIELAKEAHRRGANVTLVYGPAKHEPPRWIRTVRVVTAGEMAAEVKKAMRNADALISPAAAADYRPAAMFMGKMDSGEGKTLGLIPTKKIVSEAREMFPDKVIVGFKVETRGLIEKAHEKLVADRLDLIVANHASAIGAEESDVHIINGVGRITSFSGNKSQIAGFVLDAMLGLLPERSKIKKRL
ncbi:MAG: bifunctional phosphopantothenoylcysteine decarboxylase/phosphopantothenate--cysteine ligase CoaBC [Candidatus Eisenbacteria sp.]|nr:bifunctional phosphopantothenoylcysteine decarboxylase/phosphopantothenate--cysteine ligase CoaBC [Candidatus Eisenbacteria bacterium]